MKARVYDRPGEKRWESFPDPAAQAPSDAIARINTTTVCGADLSIVKGEVPEITSGRIPGNAPALHLSTAH